MGAAARWLRRGGLVLGLLGTVLPAPAFGQGAAAPPPLPQAEVLTAPSPVPRTDGRRHLVYELVIANPGAASAQLEGLTVVDRERRTVASFDAPAVAAMLFPFTPALAPGQTAILRADVALAPGRAVPAGLAHRLALSVPGDGQPRRHIVTGARTAVERRAPLRIGLPLRTDRVLGLIAHAPVAIDGRLTHAQRYAIDFVRLNETRDSVFTGDPQRNESYAIHGAEVVAVADGTIASVSDGQPENTPPAEPPFSGFDAVAGNRVVQDLGGGRYALYGHLQPGSLRVTPGSRVRRGDVLALVGNTGLSSGPHLHFQMMDGPGGPSALDADGLPYVFDRFTLEGTVDDLAAPVFAPAPPPLAREGEYIVAGDVIGPP